MLEIADKDIGGARIARTFSMNGKQLKRGDPDLTREEVLAIRLPNRRAMTDSNYLEVYPKPSVIFGGEKFIVSVGNNEYNVIEGRTINKEPLPRKEAEKLLHSTV